MIPLLGFLQGDSLGLLVFAQDTDTIKDIARRLQKAANVRVAASDATMLYHKGKLLPDESLVKDIGFHLLDRIDVRTDDRAMGKT